MGQITHAELAGYARQRDGKQDRAQDFVFYAIRAAITTVTPPWAGYLERLLHQGNDER
ncbi:hypothetical protein [Nocardia sp. NPDC052112]|uniref:hypothetical protein n=1 Tax=Nocardia sp. NPDC052112 TaxID=3155646 RepID=UPI00344673F5